MNTLKEGTISPDVKLLQGKLKTAGFSPGLIDGNYGPATTAAVMAFQFSEELVPDGIAGPRTLKALSLIENGDCPSAIPGVTVEIVSKMFPSTPVRNIQVNLPFVLASLVASALADKPMVLMALATIRAETEGFVPISEGKSRYNTSPNGHPFDLYDNRKDLGNRGAPDGDRFKGRGFIQLTGRANYNQHGQAIGLGNGLIANPDQANDPTIAANLLASFIKSKEVKIKTALMTNDLATARRLVNGGSHGLNAFTNAFNIGNKLIA